MITIQTENLLRDLSETMQKVQTGETVLIVQGDTPIAEIKPIAPVFTQPRPFGLAAGEFCVPDDFDAPLPEDIVTAFEAKHEPALD